MNAGPVVRKADVQADAIAPEDIRLWLEWAGGKLLSMSIPSPAPRGMHNAWPEYADDHRRAYGYTGERLRASLPRAKEIELMDEILALPSLVTDVTIRRVLNARALVTPISQRYLYSWTKIAFMLHTDRKRIVRLHFMGLCEIGRRLAPAKADAIRSTLLILST